MKKSTLFKTLILVGAIALNIVFIVYLPHYILGLLGCWQLGAWMGTLGGKLASRIKQRYIRIFVVGDGVGTG